LTLPHKDLLARICLFYFETIIMCCLTILPPDPLGYPDLSWRLKTRYTFWQSIKWGPMERLRLPKEVALSLRQRRLWLKGATMQRN